MSSIKRSRGRPRGTGLDDSPTLKKVADMLAANPSLKPTAAIKGGAIVRQELGSDVPQGLQLVVVDVLPLALGKAVEEERPILRSIGHDHAKPARSPLPWSRNTLFDEATTQIGVDKPTLGSLDRLFQTRVTDPLMPDETRDPFGFENPHGITL